MPNRGLRKPARMRTAAVKLFLEENRLRLWSHDFGTKDRPGYCYTLPLSESTDDIGGGEVTPEQAAENGLLWADGPGGWTEVRP